jgi:hypothetical protein
VRPLWTCPACGERFVSPRLWHSCGKGSFAALFARSDPNVREIFDRLAGLAAACGPVRIYPQKTRIVFQARIRFASCRPQKRALIAGFLLPRSMRSKRFTMRLDGVSKHYVAVETKLSAPVDVDAQVARWMKRAYRFGIQEHL